MKSLPEVIAAVHLLQNAETKRTKITLELKQEISDLQTEVSELIQRDKFVTELINDNHTQNNSKQCESLEISIQNLRNRLNLIDNKSRAKNILINNVEEKSTENAIQRITKVNQIMHDADNTIHVTHAYRIGQTIACLETEKQKHAAVKQAYRLKRLTKLQNAFISEDLCHDIKISKQERN